MVTRDDLADHAQRFRLLGTEDLLLHVADAKRPQDFSEIPFPCDGHTITLETDPLAGDTLSILTGYTMKSIEVLGVRLGVPSILVFAASVLSLLFLNLLLKRTYLGRAIRAVTQNRDAALLSGVNANRISAIAFGLGTAFAGIAGAMLATLMAFTPDFGRSFLLKAFCIIVLGGMESVTGVAVGALVLAALENGLGAYTDVPTSLQDAVSFALLFIALVAFPQGLPSLFTRFQRRAMIR